MNFNYQDQVAALAGAQTTAGTERGNAAALTSATALSSNRQYNELGNVVQAAQNVQYASGIWFDTGKKVNDCAVGASRIARVVFLFVEDNGFRFVIESEKINFIITFPGSFGLF